MFRMVQSFLTAIIKEWKTHLFNKCLIYFKWLVFLLLFFLLQLDSLIICGIFFIVIKNCNKVINVSFNSRSSIGQMRHTTSYFSCKTGWKRKPLTVGLPPETTLTLDYFYLLLQKLKTLEIFCKLIQFYLISIALLMTAIATKQPHSI